MQYVILIFRELNAVLLALSISSLLCYFLFGNAFLELVAKLLRGGKDDDDDDSNGGIMQRVLVPVRVRN